jgi:hypothetical protein
MISQESEQKHLYLSLVLIEEMITSCMSDESNRCSNHNKRLQYYNNILDVVEELKLKFHTDELNNDDFPVINGVKDLPNYPHHNEWDRSVR